MEQSPPPGTLNRSALLTRSPQIHDRPRSHRGTSTRSALNGRKSSARYFSCMSWSKMPEVAMNTSRIAVMLYPPTSGNARVDSTESLRWSSACSREAWPMAWDLPSDAGRIEPLPLEMQPEVALEGAHGVAPLVLRRPPRCAAGKRAPCVGVRVLPEDPGPAESPTRGEGLHERLQVLAVRVEVVVVEVREVLRQPAVALAGAAIVPDQGAAGLLAGKPIEALQDPLADLRP